MIAAGRRSKLKASTRTPVGTRRLKPAGDIVGNDARAAGRETLAVVAVDPPILVALAGFYRTPGERRRPWHGPVTVVESGRWDDSLALVRSCVAGR